MLNILFLFLFFLDFSTKYLSNIYLSWKQINLIWSYFYLELHKNTWIAFSIYVPFLKLITIFIIFFIFFYYIKHEKKKNNFYIDLAFVFILSGALGNARERIFLWSVTDFIWIKFFSILNFADIFINLGVFLYLFTIFLKKDKNCSIINKSS